MVTIELMKFSLITTALIDFQSDAFSPSNKQMDSNANLTTAGGLAMDRTSTSCCFFISLTAIKIIHICMVMINFNNNLLINNYLAEHL